MIKNRKAKYLYIVSEEVKAQILKWKKSVGGKWSNSIQHTQPFWLQSMHICVHIHTHTQILICMQNTSLYIAIHTYICACNYIYIKNAECHRTIRDK